MPVVTEPRIDSDAVDDDLAEPDNDSTRISPPPPQEATVRRAMQLGLALIVALSMLLGWLLFHTYQSRQVHVRQSAFLQAAKQGALNLTTIDWQHADADVQRILDGATGQFHDDFAARSGPFVELVKNAKSVTVGTVTEAGLESDTADTAQALVAVTVTTSNAGVAEPQPRAWRLRVFVQKAGDQARVSNVEFVS
jgi:Mce-associated membrane protein